MDELIDPCLSSSLTGWAEKMRPTATNFVQHVVIEIPHPPIIGWKPAARSHAWWERLYRFGNKLNRLGRLRETELEIDDETQHGWYYRTRWRWVANAYWHSERTEPTPIYDPTWVAPPPPPPRYWGFGPIGETVGAEVIRAKRQAEQELLGLSSEGKENAPRG